MTILHSCYTYVLNEYHNSSNQVEWLRYATSTSNTTLNRDIIRRIILHGFGEEYHINMFQKKGHNQLQELIKEEIESHMNSVLKSFQDYIFKEYKVTSYNAIINPPPTATPTEIEAIQCFICATNKKDRALPCGHSYCCCCVETMPNGKCPECNTIFDKTRVIKLYL